MGTKNRNPAEWRTPFGKYVEKRGLSLSEAALELQSSRQHLYLLATGAATPGMKLAIIIERWSRGAVTMQSWAPFIPGLRAA